MHFALGLVELVATVLVVVGLCHRLKIASPLVLIGVGILASFLPFVPQVELRPEVVLVGLLPPLLYSAALKTSLVDFHANSRAILLLSVGLVAVTTLGTGVVVHWVLRDIPWWAAFAVGAVVAPPDAVAATAIGRSIGLPRRVVTILEGESLLNDATAIVALRTAIAATVSLPVLGLHFLIAAGGGVLVGLLLFLVVGRVRRQITDPRLDSGLSFATPFGAYVAAESFHGSGVLAVVVAGLLLGHRAPILQTAQSRIAERLNWSSIALLLESIVFLLIGLQARRLIEDVLHGSLGLGRVAVACVATLAAVVVIRMLWTCGATLALIRMPVGRRPTLRYAVVVGWAGMRGVVTLAAAFVIPPGTPYRDVLLLIAFFVTAGTLFGQGLTLPWLARRLSLPSPDPGADALARATLLHQASQRGMTRLEELDEDDPHDVSAQIRERIQRRDFAAWEQLGAGENETPSQTYARWRREMIDAERGRVLEIRSTGSVAAEVVAEVLAMLDVEESMLDYSSRAAARARNARVPTALEGDCEHLREVRPSVECRTPNGCEECLRDGSTWVHLRMCTSCGHVGCCDSSPHRHASAHFHETGHPVMRSAEPGEDWRWCYIDELTG